MLRMLVVVGLVYNVEEVRTVFRSQVVKSTEFYNRNKFIAIAQILSKAKGRL